MKKRTKYGLLLAGTAVAAIYAYNKYISITASKHNALQRQEGLVYPWRHGDVSVHVSTLVKLLKYTTHILFKYGIFR